MKRLEERALERISKEFSDSERDSVIETLRSYCGPESDRVRWDILELSKGSLDNVKKYVHAAQTDYRDILYWAEYFDTDPMSKGRDPKRLVEEILAKWGESEVDRPLRRAMLNQCGFAA